MTHGHVDGTVILVDLADLQPGMVRAWNDGLSSVITGISKRTPRSRNRLVSYRATAARADGHHNTHTQEVPAGSKLPIIAVNPPTAGPCPDNCRACHSGGLPSWQGMPTLWLGVPTIPVAAMDPAMPGRHSRDGLTVQITTVTDPDLLAAGYTHEYLVSQNGMATRNGITQGMTEEKLVKLFAGESIRGKL